MKKLLLTAGVATCMATGAFASTVTANIDFVALVADIGEGGYEGSTFNFNGLDVTLSSTADAYLDGLSRGLPAGLGVCSSGLDGDNECNDPGDDNINSTGEIVTLTFGTAVTNLSGFTFRGAGHDDISASNDLVNITADTDIGLLGATVTFFGVNETFFNSTAPVGSINEYYSISFSADSVPFYLSGFTAEFTPAPVPLPASVLLLGGALAGVGALKRRKKA